MTDDQLLLVGGIVAAILGAVDVYRSKGDNLAAVAVVVLSLVLVIVGLR